MRCAAFFFLLPACFAQAVPGPGYLPHDLTAGFRDEGSHGQIAYAFHDTQGYSLKYSYRPRRWLALEAGLEQIPRPAGGAICCRYVDNANDELYLAPFGLRYVWEPEGGRVRLSAGGGGACMKYTVDPQLLAANLMSMSRWGFQLVIAGDYRLSRSGRFRAGLTARYYHLDAAADRSGLIVTVGPDFTFSFR